MSYNSKEDELSAYLLADATVFEQLCSIIVRSGQYTQKSLEGNAVMHNLTALPLEMEGITRQIKPFFINYSSVQIQYDWNDITIVGGSAFNAIEKTSQVDMDSYIQTHTTDIDAVWWPTVIGKSYIPVVVKNAPVYPAIDSSGQIMLQQHFENMMVSSYDPQLRRQRNYGITSVSPAIVTVANTYAHHLGVFLNQGILENPAFLAAIQTKVINLGYQFDSNLIWFSTETTSQLPATEKDTAAEKSAKQRRIRGSIMSGSWSITGYLELSNIHMRLKLLDVTIHDDCSSQRSKHLEESIHDPLYCSTKVINSLLRIPLLPTTMGITRVPIPSLEKLFEQQRYALTNRMDIWNKGGAISAKKVQAHHRRLQYLLDFVKFLYTNAHLQVIQSLLYVFQLHKYPTFYHEIKQKELRETDAWIASCPLYVPPFPPCVETETDLPKLQECALKKCKIEPNNPVLQDLCGKGKVLDPSICGVKKGGKTRKRRYASSSKSRF